MVTVKDLLANADWKQEKHVPVIDLPDKVKKGETLKILVSVGKEIPHPNTTEHHISWITLYFLPEGEKYPGQIGHFEFTAHGAGLKGPNTSTVYANPEVSCSFQTEKSGVILAVSYCNIHGLWESSRELKRV